MSDRMDPKLRELTFRLVAMAPEAPPFPEEAMVQLKPSPAPAAPARRRSPLVWVGAAAVIALLVVGVPLFLFGGGEDPGPTTIPPATQTSVPDTTPPPTTAPPADTFEVTYVQYYFALDMATPAGDPALVPVLRTETLDTDLSPIDTVALAVDRLRDTPPFGLPQGVGTAVPANANWTDFKVDNGVATIDFPSAFEEGGGSTLMFARLRQVVFTATQIPEINAVLFEIDGEPVEVFSGEGIVLDGPQTRADWYDDAQAIYVDTPAIGATVGSPITIAGVANVFEANVRFEVSTADGTVIASGFTTATCGSGCWGDFVGGTLYTLDEDSEGFVTVFTESAEDGSRQNVMSYPVTLLASQDPEATGDAPSYLSVGFDPMSGAGYYPGRIVTTESLVVMGGTDADAAVTVNGNPAPLDDTGSFQAKVALAVGENTITIEATRGGQSMQETLIVRYVPGGSTEFTFLTQVGSNEIVADYAQWLTGDEANQAAFEDGEIDSIEEGVPNDYYIRNVNPQLRTLSVADDVRITLISPIDVTPIDVPLGDWVALYKPDGTPWDYEAGDQIPTWDGPYFDYFGANSVYTPYWLYIDADGTVIQIEQQYIP